MLSQLGRVPRRLFWDNEPGIGRRRVTEPVAVFAGTLATKVVLLPPRDPESKGLVERRNRFFETSFMPGRSFASPGDFNAQFSDWLVSANGRVVRTLKARPVDLLAVDKDAMLPLPPAVLHLGWRNHVRLGRDYYVRVDTSDYSVNPVAIGARVDVSADLDHVRVRHGGRMVAEHARVWARGMTVTDPVHVSAAAVLRQSSYQQAHQHGGARTVASGLQAPTRDWSGTSATTTARSGCRHRDRQVSRDRRGPEGCRRRHGCRGHVEADQPTSRSR